MDYLVQVLTRYRFESQSHTRPRALWVRVFRHVSAPINTACLGAACAFFVSIFTDFRGAAELGIIAGGGLILCLIAGYTILPALLTLLPVRPRRLDVHDDGVLEELPPKAGAKWLIVPGIWIALMFMGAPFSLRTSFNPNLLDLQAPKLKSVELIRHLPTWQSVVLSRDLGMLRRVRSVVAASPLVRGTESILNAQDNYQWLHARAPDLPKFEFPIQPVNAANLAALAKGARTLAGRFAQAATQPTAARAMTLSSANAKAKLSNVNHILRQLAARLDQGAASPALARADAQALSDWQRGFTQKLRAGLKEFNPPPLNLEAVPAELRLHLVSADGEYALYIDPRNDLWNRADLAAFVTDVESRVDSVPNHPPVTGLPGNVFHSTRYIEHAFYRATAYALIAIVLLVLIDLRDIGHTMLAVSVLALGMPMMVSLMGIFNIQWNFANFFGLPILIGAGHEYGVFLVHRYREACGDARRAWRRWDVSDRALMLCAFVTSSSFGFFAFFAQHRGLKSLGEVMALGTACIYLSALLVLRPILLWQLERRRKWFLRAMVHENSRR
jgi:hypothetical protein